MTIETPTDEYLSLWRTMEVREVWRKRVAEAAKKIVAGKSRYAAVQSRTGVPWWVVGLIHHMESGCRFETHLHNGDPLTARTVSVPRGRPPRGVAPFLWEDSAVDALTLDKLDRVSEWDVPGLAAALERYNGLGYRRDHPDVPSPYLWSGTQHYTRGKYVSDGRWSATAVSQQPGAMAIAAELTRLDRSVILIAAEPDPAAEHQRTPREPERMGQTTEGPAAIGIGGVGTWQTSTEISGAFGKMAAAGKPFSLSAFAIHIASSPGFWAGLITMLGAAYWWLRRSARLKRKGV